MDENRDPQLRIDRITQVRGRVTTVVVSADLEGRMYRGFGAAVCDQRDTPSPETGVLLATGRAVTDLGRQIRKDGWSRVERHPAEDGAVAVRVRVVPERERGLLARGFDALRGIARTT